MREDRHQVEQEGQDEEEKKQKLKATFDKHREAVRGMMKERDDKKREEQAAAKAEKAAKAAEDAVRNRPCSSNGHRDGKGATATSKGVEASLGHDGAGKRSL